jgi:hypothetical protein
MNVVKMESPDSPDKVAAFYKKALAKYGEVLDCSNPPATDSERKDSSNVLTCGDDKPDKGGLRSNRVPRRSSTSLASSRMPRAVSINLWPWPLGEPTQSTNRSRTEFDNAVLVLRDDEG